MEHHLCDLHWAVPSKQLITLEMSYVCLSCPLIQNYWIIGNSFLSNWHQIKEWSTIAGDVVRISDLFRADDIWRWKTWDRRSQAGGSKSFLPFSHASTPPQDEFLCLMIKTQYPLSRWTVAKTSFFRVSPSWNSCAPWEPKSNLDLELKST